MMTLRLMLPLMAVGMLLWMAAPVSASPEMTEQAKKFITEHEKKVRPLDIAAGIAWWDANISGKDEDFAKKEKAQNRIDEALSNKSVFAELKKIKEARDKGEIDDKIAARGIDVLYLLYLEKQVDPELLKKITKKSNDVEQKFNTYRANVNGKELTDSEVRKVLHELGHSVYSSKNIPKTLPYILRMESHILTTEGVAMQFERFSKSAAWLEKMGVKVENPKAFDETASKVLRNQLLIFSRWCQVMLRFEKAMYENPQQDLNKLWWDLVEKYQMVKRPKDRNAPDYGSKIHIVSAPVYYHNYMMGQLFASQVHHAVAKEVYDGAAPNTVIYIDNKKVGDFMKKRRL